MDEGNERLPLMITEEGLPLSHLVEVMGGEEKRRKLDHQLQRGNGNHGERKVPRKPI